MWDANSLVMSRGCGMNWWVRDPNGCNIHGHSSVLILNAVLPIILITLCIKCLLMLVGTYHVQVSAPTMSQHDSYYVVIYLIKTCLLHFFFCLYTTVHVPACPVPTAPGPLLFCTRPCLDDRSISGCTGWTYLVAMGWHDRYGHSLLYTKHEYITSYSCITSLFPS